MADCGCVYSGYDGDQASVANSDWVKARKVHECCECHQPIQPGEKYERTKGCWDGEWATYDTCRPCCEIRQLLFCDGWNYTSVWDDVNEYFREGGNPMGCINKLDSTAAKEKLSAAYREFLDLKA